MTSSLSALAAACSMGVLDRIPHFSYSVENERSCKNAKTPQVICCPAGLIFNHASEGFGRKRIAWAMKRNRHSTAVCVAVLLVSTALGTQEKSITHEGTDDFPCREGAQGGPVDTHIV